jgi:hypothetical protein
MENFEVIDENRNIPIAIIIGALVVLFAVVANFVLNLEIVENLVMSWILTAFYGIFALFIVKNGSYIQKTVEVERPVYIDRPVIHETIREVNVPIQIPVENKTIEFVEKPVIQRVEVPVYRDRNVYIEKKRKKLNIIHFNYIASSEARRFHTRFCRLGKLIKKKFKIHNDDQSYFIKKHFEACKVCILHEKKT